VLRVSLQQRRSRLDELLDQIRELAAAEYQRGVRDALARVVDVAQVSGKSMRVRAPHGAARALVERVLKSGPRTIREIREAAKTEAEKLVSYQTARLELERGKKEKRYRNAKGKWSFHS